MTHPGVPDVLEAIKDVTFPAGKDDLVDAAAAAGASGDVVAALRALPPESYGNRSDVAHSVRLDAASDLGLSEGQRAAQARVGGKHGLAQQLREVPKPPIEEEEER
ncbi:DUF2795 domain-containing protein [Actinacidiphila acidipaludis]|uniref:DUF2795 domain-containing protein n=1 Tax=Actinacidiphila acidipaludis TaxID=2873382 RepID=A0ABS7QE87_9ACTN|nr:DUF2795 domain-containing protein [Streptomyces acidipaludis]MBY8881486.1 DUF2795 domain-containing protein [Streptomyces acidipaludis]